MSGAHVLNKIYVHTYDTHMLDVHKGARTEVPYVLLRIPSYAGLFWHYIFTTYPAWL